MKAPLKERLFRNNWLKTQVLCIKNDTDVNDKVLKDLDIKTEDPVSVWLKGVICMGEITSILEAEPFDKGELEFGCTRIYTLDEKSTIINENYDEFEEFFLNFIPTPDDESD